MIEIIRVENISYAGLLDKISFPVESGSITVVLSAKEEVDTCLAKLMMGFIRPERGRISIFERDISASSDKEINLFRQRIGLIYASGGLVSNLKVWENVTLPLAYANRFSREQIEKMGLEILNRIGYSGKFMDLPGHITLYQKRLAGFARAMLMCPELLIYESPLLGLNKEEGHHLVGIAQDFHREKTGRTTIFLSANPEIVPLLQDAKIITIPQRHMS